MKKWMILAAAVVLAAPVFAQTQEAFPSYIQVNGRSQMEVTPDEFYLSIVINERESKGKITVETQQRQMIDALKKLGVDVEKQLKVANMSSDFYKKASSLTTAKYQLLLHSAAEVGDVTAALGDLGISNVGIVRVTRSDIDSLKEQVRLDAIRNAKENGVENIRFVAADATEWMQAAAAEKLSIDILLMDPPRSGSTPEFLSAAVKMAPRRIVYISCCPETQARDLALLQKGGYRVTLLQPVDMFPHTEHIENIAVLERRSTR